MRHKIANTATFLGLCLKADQAGYNRRVNTEALIEAIDADGIHVVTFSMLHNDKEIRTGWMVKLANSMVPERMFLDMSFEDYEALGEVGV